MPRANVTARSPRHPAGATIGTIAEFGGLTRDTIASAAARWNTPHETAVRTPSGSTASPTAAARPFPVFARDLDTQRRHCRRRPDRLRLRVRARCGARPGRAARGRPRRQRRDGRRRRARARGFRRLLRSNVVGCTASAAARTLWQAHAAGVARLSGGAAPARHSSAISAPQDLLTIARREPRALGALRREYEARRAAGLEHAGLTAASRAPRGGDRRRRRDQDARRRARSLPRLPRAGRCGRANAARRSSSDSESRRIRAGRKSVEVTTAGGTSSGPTP